MTFKRITVIVLDSVGIGELPDAAQYGDTGAHTLGHIIERVPELELPNLRKLGLGNIATLGTWQPESAPSGYFGKMAEVSVGKDTMTGHWELAGLRIDKPFRTFPDGFPAALIRQFEDETGRSVIGNKPASGTEILDELGAEQMRSGSWIVYTSADSVFQLAAHEDVIPLEELYNACRVARRLTMKDEFSVGRVIARPYLGGPGAFKRTSNRHDYAVKPPHPTVLNALKAGGVDVVSVGKINDIFSGEGIARATSTKSNAHGIEVTIQELKKEFGGFVFTNLVDFDSLYGHRRDPEGYGRALEEFDRALPDIMAAMKDSDLLLITADHGNDPIHAGTDHTREYVPLLAWSPSLTGAGQLADRATFADVAATVADNFGIEFKTHGSSFLPLLK
ncbi:phosphopentomutase [Cohnella sp. CIP 111063]|uniref:phosphopentomutase n=1 Tax=unclassified Cohnella TaxID=2636738 RepID=UPI000B8BB548|nr:MULTISPECIES: phosphopentomutase [unclassified Cohnella]OXS61278.1 phosphopentomutase [Cohnella sp. CIP 111063]PRX73854.1 phosphopentomutase [Cohnella sp. SGD-V74]